MFDNIVIVFFTLENTESVYTMAFSIAKKFEAKVGEKGMIWVRVHLQSGSNLYDQVITLNHKVETFKFENEALKSNIQTLEQ